jgi:hypothetical protein
MDHFREIKNNLKWHNEGKFEVVLVNGIITKLSFCEPGKGPDDSGKCLTSTSYKFLQAVHACLGDLFAFIEEENKRLGYSYAREVDVPSYHEDEITENTYSMNTEAKLRPLINYAHQPELMEPSLENEVLRDIG